MKRLFDLVAASAALVVLSPVMVGTAIAVAVTSRGGVFFKGPRVGQHGKPFNILKFRSMVENAEGNGAWNVGMDDPRVTSIGKFLRASKLDELPQLINVVRGEMSLVGPRPELQYYVDMYTPDEERILELKPGVTDWASLVHRSQHSDFTEAEDPDEHYLHNIRPTKLRLQLYQLEHQSFSNDLRVLFSTFAALLRWNVQLPSAVRVIVEEEAERIGKGAFGGSAE